MREGVAAAHAWDEVESIPFFALAPNRHRAGTVSVADLFYPLPVAGDVPNSAAGDWFCSTNDKTDFTLDIGFSSDFQ